MKERDTTFPGCIVKTKSKRYMAVCPACKEVITRSALQFRIQASDRLRQHLKTCHNMTEQQGKELAAVIQEALKQAAKATIVDDYTDF
jgi:BED zinc finger